MSEFIGYVGSPELHDAVIERVDFQPERLVVGLRVRDRPGEAIRIEFARQSAVEQERPVGMVLYALAELASGNGRRRFSFVNWDEEDDRSPRSGGGGRAVV